MTTILIVEDEESLSDPLAYLLRKEGFEAVVAADGQEGLDLFASQDIDLVLLDLMLPGMSGTDVCKKLRAESSVPIIMVTARDSEIDVGDTKTLDVHVKRLRTKIEAEPSRPTQLVTVRGLGYKFEA